MTLPGVVIADQRGTRYYVKVPSRLRTQGLVNRDNGNGLSGGEGDKKSCGLLKTQCRMVSADVLGFVLKWVV